MKNPKLSLIIPVYNTGKPALKIVAQALESYDHLEIIIVDDGSTDNTPELLQTLKDPRVKIFRQKNSGAASARNLGLSKISGDFVIFLDSDDEIRPDFLPTLVRLQTENNPTLALIGLKQLRGSAEVDYYQSPLLERDRNETDKAYILRLLIADGRLYPVVNKIFRAGVIKKHRLKFDSSRQLGEDLIFVLSYLDALKNEELTFACENSPLYIYHYSGVTAKNASLDWRNWQNNLDFIQTWLGPQPSEDELVLVKSLRRRWRLSWLSAKSQHLPLANQLWRLAHKGKL